MSLSNELSAFAANVRARLSPDRLAVMDRATDDLRGSGILEGVIRVGDVVPDFTLPNARSQPVSLASLRARGPVVVSFYRGGWCPYCNLELRALQRALPQIRVESASLVAISPELPDHSLSTADKNALEFEVLSDVGNQLARALGLVFELPGDLREVYRGFGLDVTGHNGDDSWELPIPATLVVGRDGVAEYVFADADYTRRLDLDEILAALRAVRRRAA